MTTAQIVYAIAHSLGYVAFIGTGIFIINQAIKGA